MREPRGVVGVFPGPPCCHWNCRSWNMKDHQELRRLPCAFCPFLASFLSQCHGDQCSFAKGTASSPMEIFSVKVLALYLVSYHDFSHSTLRAAFCLASVFLVEAAMMTPHEPTRNMDGLITIRLDLIGVQGATSCLG